MTDLGVLNAGDPRIESTQVRLDAALAALTKERDLRMAAQDLSWQLLQNIDAAIKVLRQWSTIKEVDR